ncbi:hypothetical protein AB8Z70_09040 [Klebsiella pneumoniae subsp. pneumoniae]
MVNDASPEDLDTIVSRFNDERIIYSTNEKELWSRRSYRKLE